jgi:hypothetical protein
MQHLFRKTLVLGVGVIGVSVFAAMAIAQEGTGLGASGANITEITMDPVIEAPAQKSSDAVVSVSELPVDLETLREAAETATQLSGNAATATGQQDETNSVFGQGDINPNTIPSVVFTHWEYMAVREARNNRGVARPPTEAELERELNTREDVQQVKPPPEERDISLGGIVFVRSNDWTIWLNGQRVTPNALPKEIIDLKVFREYIEMKWFDEWSNQIYPIRLRPHQRFNIDTRIFLPG